MRHREEASGAGDAGPHRERERSLAVTLRFLSAVVKEPIPGVLGSPWRGVKEGETFQKSPVACHKSMLSSFGAAE